MKRMSWLASLFGTALTLSVAQGQTHTGVQAENRPENFARLTSQIETILAQAVMRNGSTKNAKEQIIRLLEENRLSLNEEQVRRLINGSDVASVLKKRQQGMDAKESPRNNVKGTYSATIYLNRPIRYQLMEGLDTWRLLNGLPRYARGALQDRELFTDELRKFIESRKEELFPTVLEPDFVDQVELDELPYSRSAGTNDPFFLLEEKTYEQLEQSRRRHNDILSTDVPNHLGVRLLYILAKDKQTWRNRQVQVFRNTLPMSYKKQLPVLLHASKRRK